MTLPPGTGITDWSGNTVLSLTISRNPGTGAGVAVGVGTGVSVGVVVGKGFGVGVGSAHVATSTRSRSMVTVRGLAVAAIPAGKSPAHPANTVWHEAVTTTVVPEVYIWSWLEGTSCTLPCSPGVKAVSKW